MKRLRDAVRRKRPRFWSSGDWLLHHDNAPAHTSNLVQQFLAKHKIVQLRQPSYSPDIAPCDFWISPKLKMAFKGKRFDDIETIQSNATRKIKVIPKCRILFGHTSYLMATDLDILNTGFIPTFRNSMREENIEILLCSRSFSDRLWTKTTLSEQYKLYVNWDRTSIHVITDLKISGGCRRTDDDAFQD